MEKLTQPDHAGSSPNDLSFLHQLFETAEEYDASDIHLTRDESPYFRVGGHIREGKLDPLSADDIYHAISPTLTDHINEQYAKRGYADFAYEDHINLRGQRKRLRYRM